MTYCRMCISPDITVYLIPQSSSKQASIFRPPVFSLARECAKTCGSTQWQSNAETVPYNRDTVKTIPLMNAPGEIRTHDLRFRKPLSKNDNHLQNQALTENDKSVLASCLAFLREKHPDLAKIVECWPDLPEDIREKVKELVKTAGK